VNKDLLRSETLNS